MESSDSKKIYNFLTFDIEEWYSLLINQKDCSIFESPKIKIESKIDIIIDICNEYNVKSTCFVLGRLAENKPNIVKKLSDNGHEIASHSYNHDLVYSMKPSEFKKDLIKSKNILEDITGKKVTGYRAPCWSINEDCIEWYYKILEEIDIEYSSSIYPAKTYLYGIKGFPKKIHYPIIKGREINVLEIPSSTINVLGMSIGFSGGFFLRFLPTWFINKIIYQKNKKNENVVIYAHPREFGKGQPRLPMSFAEGLINYYNIYKTEKKIKKIISSNIASFKRIDEYLISKGFCL